MPSWLLHRRQQQEGYKALRSSGVRDKGHGHRLTTGTLGYDGHDTLRCHIGWGLVALF